MVDSILCTESVKYLYINAFKHVIQSTTKNKSRYATVCGARFVTCDRINVTKT